MSKFGDAFKAARKKFEGSGSPNDYVFEFNGKKYSILKKGETKSGVMKKFKGVSRSLTPKLRPTTPEKKAKIPEGRGINATVPRKGTARPGGTAVPPSTGVGGGIFAGKGKGSDKPKAKTGPKVEQKRRADKKSSMPDELSNAPMDSSKGRTMSDLKGEAKLRNQKPRNPRDNQAKTGMSFRDEAMLRRLARKLEAEKATKRRLKREDTKNANRIQRDSESRRRSGQTNMPTPSKPQISAAARRKMDNEYERPQRVGKDAPRGRMLADDYYDAYNLGGDVPAKKPMVMKGGKKIPAYAADGIGKMNKGGMTKKSGYMGGGMAKKKSGYMGGGMTKKKGVMTYNMGGMVKSQVNNLKGKK